MDQKETEFIQEALRSAMRELQELENQYEWFISPSIGRIQRALKILHHEKTKHKNPPV